MTQASATTQTATPTWLKIAVFLALILALWGLFTARSAASTAQENQAMRTVPEMELTLVPGGPERFADSFESAMEDAGDAEFEVGARAWLTVIVENRGDGDASDTALEADVLAPQAAVAVGEMASFEDLEMERQEDLLELTLGDVDAGETATVFLGFETDALPDALAEAWAADHRLAVTSITATTDSMEEPAATLYGSGL